jgi:pyruvate formate lyase activating enzyme
MDIADACREAGILNVAVTAGYITPQARREFYAKMDAANVDLKAFTDEFYVKVCGARLKPVLDTLAYLRHETSVWFEITTLLIPGKNDSDEELRAEARWIMRELGPDVPVALHRVPSRLQDDRLRRPRRHPHAGAPHRDGGGPPLRLHGQRPRPGGGTTFCPAAARRSSSAIGIASTPTRSPPEGRLSRMRHRDPGPLRIVPGADQFGRRRIPLAIR